MRLILDKKPKGVRIIEGFPGFGLIGTIVSEILAESTNLNIFFRRIGINDENILEIGTQKYLKEINGLSSEGIMNQIKVYLNK